MLHLRLTTVLVFVSFFINVFGNDAWNDLKITWGPDPFNENYFVSLPRDQILAMNLGWLLSERGCDRLDGNGNRYHTLGDVDVQVVYDRNGYVGGIAAVIPKNLPFNFPSKQIQPYFLDQGDHYSFTAYFTNPNTICRQGTKSTGDRLVVKGQSANLTIPMTEVELLAERKWTKGKCFNTMGQHYWLDISGKPVGLDTNKDDFFPMFLLYNKGKLNAFGFAFNGDLQSPKYEHPTVPVIGLFMDPVPKFFSDVTQSKILSTLHIFLDSTPLTNFC